jgi:hypothetical protein
VTAPGELAFVLGDIERFVRRFVVLTNEQVYAVAVWVLHTHCLAAAERLPTC